VNREGPTRRRRRRDARIRHSWNYGFGDSDLVRAQLLTLPAAGERSGDVVIATAARTRLMAIRGKATPSAAGPTRLLPDRLARVFVLTGT
jgi:hypothetical protein